MCVIEIELVSKINIMKAKTFNYCIVVTGFLFLFSSLSGQLRNIYENPHYGTDSASRMECASNLSIMNQYVKINTLEYAYESWHYCFFNCPKSSKNIYIHGAKILKYKIENETDEMKQNEYIDTLMLLYDQRIEYFGQPGYVLGMKGIDLLRYRKSAIEEAYGYLEKSVNMPNEIPDESVAVTFISTSFAMLQQGLIAPDIMINNYIKIMDILEEKIASGDTDPNIKLAIDGVEKIFAESGAADCKSLINIFSPQYPENSDNAQFLKKVLSLLAQTGCEKSELYAKAAEKLYSLEPSAEAAAKLGGLFAVKEEYEKANGYFLKAVENETDVDRKALYYYQLGKIAYTTKEYYNARKYCQLAIDLRSNYGEAYILIGSAYAASSSTCGSNDFEQQAVYWAAVDKFIKAKSVDPTVAEIADEQIRAYSQRFPNNENAFFNGYTDGQSYTVGCWINETTTVRTTK
jgi:tetratricopeptide (TPR) repeat protein